MMPIFRGGTELLAGDIVVGGTVVQEVYVGTLRIWPPEATLGGPRVLENDADTRVLEGGVDIRVTEDIS